MRIPAFFRGANLETFTIYTHHKPKGLKMALFLSSRHHEEDR
jgi:hypothetical protein